VPSVGTTQYREQYKNMPNGDSAKMVKEELKRERAQTLNIVDGGKRRKKWTIIGGCNYYTYSGYAEISLFH